jgi:Excreted virulence factor EspC, type VII ESX diderm
MAPPRLEVDPAELRGAAGTYDRLARDLSAQAGKLDSLFAACAAAAGDPGLANAISWAATDYADAARKVSGSVSAQAGALRGAATSYEHGDHSGAGTVSSTPTGGPR